jgi:hypothetical protein
MIFGDGSGLSGRRIQRERAAEEERARVSGNRSGRSFGARIFQAIGFCTVSALAAFGAYKAFMPSDR